MLEIGCFEGQGTLALLDLLGDARITVVDSFVYPGQLDRFKQNTAGRKVTIITGKSADALRGLSEDGHFDLVYVDGSHLANDVLVDAVLAWRLLKPGGAMLFDDYVGLTGESYETPQVAVDAFVACYHSDISEARRVGVDQFIVVKL